MEKETIQKQVAQTGRTALPAYSTTKQRINTTAMTMRDSSIISIRTDRSLASQRTLQIVGETTVSRNRRVEALRTATSQVDRTTP